MQTFLPYPDFKESAKCLDYRRLGKQRVEAYQLSLALTIDRDSSWINHPATKMWKGYELALLNYMDVMIDEWMSRGYKNNMCKSYIKQSEIILPKWFGDDKFHASHRSNLLRKDYSYYSNFGWKEESNMEYVWPL